MSRIIDEPYFTYSAYSALTTGIQVKMPQVPWIWHCD